MQNSQRDTNIKNRLLDSVGEGEGGMIWEKSIETCILSYVKQDRQSRFDAWDRVLRAGALGWPRGMGWGGRWEEGSGWGTHVHPWLIHVNVWQKPLQYCKIISLQLKQIMATHSIILAWRIPGTEEPGGLPAMGSHRVGHDWSDLAAVAAKQINFFKKP